MIVLQVRSIYARFSEAPMRPIFLFVSLTLIAGALRAEDASPEVKASIDKGLIYLAKEAMTWKEVRKCSSCHQVPMALWSLNEAKKLGYTVDEKAITDLTEWVVAQDDPGKVFPKPAAKVETPKAETPKTEVPKTENPE